MTVFLDTSAVFAALDPDDALHDAAVGALDIEDPTLTSTLVLSELWNLTRRRYHRRLADTAVDSLMRTGTEVADVGQGDLRRALEIGEEFPDQPFSLVDRTSFAVMMRLGISRVATFDSHFAVFRYGAGRRRAFEIVR